jgi:GDP-L-fucose synthase
MRAFVTGGNGFLGTHFVKKLKEDGYEVTAPSRTQLDLRNPVEFRKIRENFDLVVHLAAHTQAGDWCLTHQGEQWLLNQQINTNVLTWWHEMCPNAKMIAIGTSCSYPIDHVLTEENYLIGNPIESLRTYAMTKRIMLEGLQALDAQYGQDFLYVIPSTLYGSGYHTDNRQLHFIFDLIRKILLGKNHGSEVELWGDGYQRRELVHVEDFILNTLRLLNSGESGVYNLGSGIDYSIREYAGFICKQVDFPEAKLTYNTEKYVGARSKLLDISKAVAVLDAYESRDILVGMSETVEWFEKYAAQK